MQQDNGMKLKWKKLIKKFKAKIQIDKIWRMTFTFWMKKVLLKVNLLKIWRNIQILNKITKMMEKICLELTGIVINLAVRLLNRLQMKIECSNKKNKVFLIKNRLMKSYFFRILNLHLIIIWIKKIFWTK